MNFPNYIFRDYILSFIIKYICKNKKQFLNFISNEPIVYSLVCKDWFNYVSHNLTLELKFKNYRILSRFIQTTIDENQQKFKLIKLNNSIKVYYSIKEFSREFSEKTYNNELYKKIYVYYNYMESTNPMSILEQIKSNLYPSNCRFIFIINPTFMRRSGYSITGNNDNENIKKIYVKYNSDINLQIFKPIKLNSKRIDFGDGEETSPFTFKFKFQSNHLQSINIKNILSLDYQQSSLFINHVFNAINSKKVNFSISFEKMLFKDQNYNYQDIDELMESRLKSVVNSLQYDSTLKSIEINHTCNINFDGYKCLCFKQTQDPYNNFGWRHSTPIYRSLKTILTSKYTSIETLKINSTIKLELNLIDALKQNNTIKNLYLYEHGLNFLINSGILKQNKSIKHLVLQYGKAERNSKSIDSMKECDLNGLELLRNDKEDSNNSITDGIDLYSITFELYSKGVLNIKSYINKLLNHSYPVKEFNIFIPHDKRIKYQLNNEKNSIINIYYC